MSEELPEVEARGKTRKGSDRLPHHQRGRRRPTHSAACPALLGNQVPAVEAAQARRRAALLPARGHRAAAADLRPALHPGLHNQGRSRLLRDGTDEGPQATTAELPLGDPPPAAEEQETAALRAALGELEEIARALRKLAA